MSGISVRRASVSDLECILNIYNQGIEDRIATLEEAAKDAKYMNSWFREHGGRYVVLVGESEGRVLGFASLNPYSHRYAYAGVADLSIYVERDWRGKGIGTALLKSLETIAKENEFYKIVLFTFPFNTSGQALYRKIGFREVGVFHNQGKLDGKFVDVMAMEKLL